MINLKKKGQLLKKLQKFDNDMRKNMPKFESSRLNSGARNEKTYAQYKQTNIGNTLTFSSH